MAPPRATPGARWTRWPTPWRTWVAVEGTALKEPALTNLARRIRLRLLTVLGYPLAIRAALREASGVATTHSARPPLVTLTLVGALAATVGLGVVSYGVGVLMPYYVNDLDRFPLAEVAGGAHDPKDLWPQGPAAGLVQIAGLLAALLLPLLLGVSALASAGVLLYGLIAERPHVTRREVLTLLGVLAVSAAGVVYFASPMGTALTSWRLD